MEEMKNMLKLSMEMQMDVQRAIRQEVAAAVSQASGNLPAHFELDGFCVDFSASKLAFQRFWGGHLQTRSTPW